MGLIVLFIVVVAAGFFGRSVFAVRGFVLLMLAGKLMDCGNIHMFTVFRRDAAVILA